MSQQIPRSEMGGAGIPKEWPVDSVEALRMGVRYNAESQVDIAMTLPPYREVAHLVLQGEIPTLPEQMPPEGTTREDYALAA